MLYGVYFPAAKDTFTGSTAWRALLQLSTLIMYANEAEEMAYSRQVTLLVQSRQRYASWRVGGLP